MPAADIERAAHLYAGAERACILWGLGVTEHLYGSECVQLICNLALLTGNVGRPGAALLPLRGQNNVQGSSDHGALPDTFTDYRPVTDDEVTSSFERRWGVTMKRERGMKIPEMFDAAVEGSLKAMYIFGEDVAQTDPNTDARDPCARVARLPGLPGHLRDRDDQVRRRDPAGVRRSSRRRARSRTPSGGCSWSRPRPSRPGRRRPTSRSSPRSRSALGHDMGYETPSDVMDEIAEMTPRYAGISHERIGRGGLQWPVAPDGTDTPILYEERFELEGGKAPLRRAAVQAARRPGRRRVPADPRHGPPPRALQRRAR